MIHIEDNLYLDADKYQFILTEAKVIEKGDRAGETDYRPVGYYPTISTLLTELTDRKVRDGIKRGASLKAIQQELAEWAKGLKSPLTANLKDAVAAYEENTNEQT